MKILYEGVQRLARWAKALDHSEYCLVIVHETCLQDFSQRLHEGKLPLPQKLYLAPKTPMLLQENTFQILLELEALGLQAEPMLQMQASPLGDPSLPGDQLASDVIR